MPTTDIAPLVTVDGIELREGTAALIHEDDGSTTYAIFQGTTPSGLAYLITGSDVLTGRRRFVPPARLTYTARVIVDGLAEWVICNHAHVDDSDVFRRITVGPMPYARAFELVNAWYDFGEKLHAEIKDNDPYYRTPQVRYIMAHFIRHATRAELAAFAAIAP